MGLQGHVARTPSPKKKGPPEEKTFMAVSCFQFELAIKLG